MQNEITMAGSVSTYEQRRSKLLWLWMPTSLLAVLGLALGRIEPRWCVLGLGVATLWAVLASLAFGIREGMTWGGGYDQGVGLFPAYRRWPMLLASVCTYLCLLVVGLVPLLWPLPDQEIGVFMMLGLPFALALVPIDLCNWRLAHHGNGQPTMRQALSLWLPAFLFGQLLAVVALSMLSLLRTALVEPLSFWMAPCAALVYLMILVGIHRTTLSWQRQVDEANQRAEAAHTGRRLAEAQLAVLQAQIEPHFLYNTLATVQYLLKGEPAMADFLLTQLIRYLRLAMPSMRQYSSTLGREFELTEAYLQITRLRMGGRLDVDLDLPVALQALEFPPLVLQTLVENAIKHGVEPKAGPVRIRVFASRSEAGLEVGVQDDGVGLGGAPTQGGGTGLRNIRERLQGIYGDRARLSVLGLPQGGVLARVTIAIPQD